MLTKIASVDLPPPAGPYSSGLAVGGFVFLAGQGPFDTRGRLVGSSFEEQARRALSNLDIAAHEAGGSLSDVVRLGVHLHDIANFEAMNQIAAEFLTEPLPARTTLRVDLARFDIELDAILALRSESAR